MSRSVLTLPTHVVGPVPFRVAAFVDAVASVVTTAEALGGEAGGMAPEDCDASPGVAVHFANAYTVALADSDTRYAELLDRPGSAVFTDGVPVAWVGKRGYPAVAASWDRVYGPDVMEAVFDVSGPDGPRHYLLGGSPETLALLESEIAERWPRAVVVGAESPAFRALSAAEVAEQDARIRDSGATIVWVGLGTPKQDWEVARLADSVPVVAMAVGASAIGTNQLANGAVTQPKIGSRDHSTAWPSRSRRSYIQAKFVNP